MFIWQRVRYGRVTKMVVVQPVQRWMLTCETLNRTCYAHFGYGLGQVDSNSTK